MRILIVDAYYPRFLTHALEQMDVSALGYREMLSHLEGGTDIASALAATVRATRRFAKRQRTWFRREPGIVWRHPEVEGGSVAALAEEFLAGARA